MFLLVMKHFKITGEIEFIEIKTRLLCIRYYFKLILLNRKW